MSTIVSSVATNPTGVCSTQQYSQLPSQDFGCALGSISGLPSNYANAMSKCCKDAPVEKWASDCALWCLASGQSIGDLTGCLQKEGVAPNVIFCSGNMTASATGKVSGSGTVKATATSSQTGTASGSGATGKSTSSPGAAPGLLTEQSVSKAGVGMIVMLFISAAAGALL